MLIRNVLYNAFCIIAGGSIAAGFVSFITLLGVFQKLAEKYKTAKYTTTMENIIIAGVTLGNLFYMLDLRLPLGQFGYGFFNLFGGLFIGCLVGALAETLNIFPIISRRYGIRDLLPYVLVCAGLGKAVGSIIQLFLFNNP